MFDNYLAAALRNLIRNRTHAAINLFGLALGFAAALLIALFVRDEYTYDRFFPGYRDVYLLTEIRDFTDRHLINERWDCSFPDLAEKLSVQFPQIATAARIMTADNPPHIRQGQVEADEAGFLWVDPSFFRIMPLKSLAGDLQTALATPDSVVLTRTAARKYFGRDKPLGELLEVNPAMGSDAAKVSTVFNTSHPMRVTAIVEDLPSNSYLKGDVFGSSLAAYSQFALYDLTPDQGPFRMSGMRTYTFIRLRPGTLMPQMEQELSAFATHNSDTSTVYPPGFTLGLHLTPIGDLHLSPPSAYSISPRGDRTLLAALTVIAVLIITSASFNFVTLMTARAAQRAIETGVRKAAGAVGPFGRTAHQGGRHQEGHGCQLDRHSALDARRLQPAGPVGQRDRLAVRVLHDAALARGVCSSRCHEPAGIRGGQRTCACHFARYSFWTCASRRARQTRRRTAVRVTLVTKAANSLPGHSLFELDRVLEFDFQFEFRNFQRDLCGKRFSACDGAASNGLGHGMLDLALGIHANHF